MLGRLIKILSILFHLVGLTLSILVSCLVFLTIYPICYVITGDANLYTEWLIDWMGYHVERLS